MEGDSCGSHSGPPEAWSSEKSRLTEEERGGDERRGERDESVVVYLDMLHSVFNARITIKMLRLISYVYKTARQGCTSAQVMRTEAENRSGSQNVWSLVGRSINE